MRHTRDEVIARTVREFELLDQLVADLPDAGWDLLAPRSEGQEPWTVKDVLAHITYWKAYKMPGGRRQQLVPPLERGLTEHEENHLIWQFWHARSPQEVLAWHHHVHAEVLAALQAAPESYFNDREHRPDWPYDLTSHATRHRARDIERALK